MSAEYIVVNVEWWAVTLWLCESLTVPESQFLWVCGPCDESRESGPLLSCHPVLPGITHYTAHSSRETGERSQRSRLVLVDYYKKYLDISLLRDKSRMRHGTCHRHICGGGSETPAVTRDTGKTWRVESETPCEVSDRLERLALSALCWEEDRKYLCHGGDKPGQISKSDTRVCFLGRTFSSF